MVLKSRLKVQKILRSNTYIDIYLSVQGWTLWYFHLRKYQRVCVCFYLFTAKNEWSHSLALCFRYLCAGSDEKAIKVDSRWDVMQTVISPQATQGFFFKLRRKIPDTDKVWEEEKSEAQCEIILINVTDAAARVCVCVCTVTPYTALLPVTQAQFVGFGEFIGQHEEHFNFSQLQLFCRHRNCVAFKVKWDFSPALQQAERRKKNPSQTQQGHLSR